MSRKSWLNILKNGSGLALIFVLAAYQADSRIAAWFLASGIVGYLNDFGVIHTVLSTFKGEKVGYRTLLLVLVALLGNAVILFYGYGIVVALTTACFLALDAIVLRFAGPPIGVPSSEP